VNGEIWEKGGMPTFPKPNLWAMIYPNEFSIGASKSNDNTNQEILFDISSPLKVGIYKVQNVQGKKNSGGKFSDYRNECYYQTDSDYYTGELEIIKYDTINKIIAGRFKFKATKYSSVSTGNVSKKNCDSIVNITEGRFDINYIP
jgi:hypothetical protein